MEEEAKVSEGAESPGERGAPAPVEADDRDVEVAEPGEGSRSGSSEEDMAVVEMVPGDAWADWMEVGVAALAFAAASSGFGLVVASLALATKARYGSTELATGALALEFFSRACVSIPAASMARQHGRKPVILCAALLGVLGAMMAFLDFYAESYVLYFGGICLIGVANCVAQQLRFVAAEAVAAKHKPRALAVTVAGGTIAAFVGPELAPVSRGLLTIEFAGCFLVMACCYVCLFLLTLGLQAANRSLAGGVVPDSEVMLCCCSSMARGEDEEKGAARGDGPRADVPKALDAAGMEANSSWWTNLSATVRRSTDTRKGIIAVVVAWSCMFLVMSAAPLAITGHEGGYSFEESTRALQVHLILMFLPGLLGTGDLIRILGPDAVIGAGLGLYTVCSFFTYAATDHVRHVPLWIFMTILAILGLAWNFIFVAGSALMVPKEGRLTLAESKIVQGFAEACTFAVVALVAASSGAILGAAGWRGLNLCILPVSACLIIFMIYESSVSAKG